jgi:hypothetical protein
MAEKVAEEAQLEVHLELCQKNISDIGEDYVY